MDPIGYSANDNDLYRSYGNNPSIRNDPKGLDFWKEVLDAFGTPVGQGGAGVTVPLPNYDNPPPPKRGARWLPPVGRTPTREEDAFLRQPSGWPGLKSGDFTITGPKDEKCNCHGYSTTGTTDLFLEFPPPGWQDRSYPKDDFIKQMKDRGFEEVPCIPTLGSILIAVYVNEKGNPTHSARHITGEWWESKLGVEERICHKREQLEGNNYGKVGFCMKKKLNTDPIGAVTGGGGIGPIN